MIRPRWHAILAVAALLAVTADLDAQTAPKDPHIGYVYPTGGRQGTDFEVTVGGQYIKEANGSLHLRQRGQGGSRQVVPSADPGGVRRAQPENPTSRARTWRRSEKKAGKTEPITDEMVYKMAGITENDLKEMEIYRKRDADPKRQPNDQIAEELTLKITIDAKAELGKREMRVLTPGAMSNPIWFQVGQWEERRETEPNDETPDPVIGATLPVVVNGQIMPGEVDRFSFTARKGARLVIAADARELMPYLADAVPGWFQAVLALYDSTRQRSGLCRRLLLPAGSGDLLRGPRGRQVRGRNPRFHLPRTRGFRLPHHAGRVAFCDRHLPAGRPRRPGGHGRAAGLESRRDPTEGPGHRGPEPARSLVLRSPDRQGFRAFPAADRHDDRNPGPGAERPAGRRPRRSTLPIIVNGRIDRPDDKDVFRFDAVRDRRRRGLCPPRRFPAGFGGLPDRCHGQGDWLQR